MRPGGLGVDAGGRHMCSAGAQYAARGLPLVDQRRRFVLGVILGGTHRQHTGARYAARCLPVVGQRRWLALLAAAGASTVQRVATILAMLFSALLPQVAALANPTAHLNFGFFGGVDSDQFVYRELVGLCRIGGNIGGNIGFVAPPSVVICSAHSPCIFVTGVVRHFSPCVATRHHQRHGRHPPSLQQLHFVLTLLAGGIALTSHIEAGNIASRRRLGGGSNWRRSTPRGVSGIMVQGSDAPSP